MTRRGAGKIRALFTSRPIRIALVAPIAGLALLASQGRFQPSSVAFAYSGCIPTPHGTAVLYNPSFTVTGIVDATGCARGIVYDYSGGVHHGGTISGAVIFGATDVSGGDGDAVFLRESGTVTILNSTIKNNDDSAVDEFDSSDLVMIHDTMSANGGSTLDIGGDSTALIDASLITGTHTGDDGDGAGVHLYHSGLVKITRSNISRNYGIGVDDGYQYSNLFMSNDTLNGNADFGVFAHDGANATINNSLITGTLYQGGGGTIHGDGVALIFAANVSVANSRMTNNKHDGVYVYGDDASLRNDVMGNNGNNGLYVYDGSATATASLFVRNNTTSSAAAGIYLDFLATANLTNAVIEANVHDGVFVSDGDLLTMTGSFILLNQVGVLNFGRTHAYRSVVCKNTLYDLENYGYFTPDNRTQVCKQL
jgi:hypothetical protein